ncbi:MAG TPA: hypothetical protein P5328_00030 [Candidatus Paceibacterota bacterium]|nr:hypothetical protein [Candidatus Paceibacterota bacterium]HRZ34282.1 hypothetical protein [Candidatus Paceibacterota bacterium]
MNLRKILSLVFVLTMLPMAARADDMSGSLELTDCFSDGLYRFQSVQVSAGPEKAVYNPGESIEFVGSVINENLYPVVDGNVFVRISKVNANSATVDTVWHDVVDEFMAVSDISISDAASQPISFSWQAPGTIGAGDYRADFFFSVDKRFNLGGLPFTNEIVIGTSYFEIAGSSVRPFVLDRNSTKVNDQTYLHIGEWPDVPADSAVEISQPLKNLSNKEISLDVTYDLYYWDSLRDSDKLDSRSEKVVVPANGSVNLSYTIEKVSEPVYYLRIKATNAGLSSIVNVRVVSSLVAKSRINYPALNVFPLIKDQEATAFSCFHMTSYATDTGRIVLTVSDENDRVFSSGEYAGEISSQMDAVAMNFSPNKNISFAKLKAELFDSSGKLVDQYEAVYDCEEIGSESCRQLDQETATAAFNYLELIYVVLIVLVLVLIFVRIRKIDANSWSRKALSIIAIILVLILAYIVVRAVALKSGISSATAEVVSGDGRTKTETKSTPYKEKAFTGNRLVVYGNLNLTHTVTLTGGDSRDDGGFDLDDGDSVGINWNRGCSFTATGGAWDTPVCGSSQTFHSGDRGHDGWIKFLNESQTATIVSSNPEVVSCSGSSPNWTCTGLESGYADISVHIDQDLFYPEMCVEWTAQNGTACVECTSNIQGKYETCNDRGLNLTVTTPSYNPTWRIYVGSSDACGPAAGETLSDSDWPLDEEDACAYGEMENPGDDGDTYSWKCGDVSCSANKDDGDDDDPEEPPYEPHHLLLIPDDASAISPNIVNPGEQCTVSWEVDSSQNGSCTIINIADQVVGSAFDYTAGGENSFEALVDPQNEYRIVCTDSAPAEPGGEPESVTSTVLRCILNPNVVEQ